MDYKDYMDYNQRDYFFQMQQMRQMPFSPMHPYPDLYMNEIETERDLQYLQQMYPTDAKRMQRMETGADADKNAGGSDEMNAMQMRRADYGPGPELPFVPDRRPGHPPFEPDRRPERPPHHGPKPGPGRPPMDSGRRNLLEVLLYNEMYKRRCKRRRTRRFW